MYTGLTRRDWMLAAACWSQVLRAQTHTHPNTAPVSARLVYFDLQTANEIEALAAQIIPDDGTPGAREAGVIRFIDQALAGYDRDKQALYRDGLAAAQEKRSVLFPGSLSIAALAPEQQIALVQAIETTEFFRALRLHTILGFFGHPKHGGNRGRAAWNLIGFDNAMGFRPPFGYYDAPEGAR